jgi:hypothetical protein
VDLSGTLVFDRVAVKKPFQNYDDASWVLTFAKAVGKARQLLNRAVNGC